MNRKKWTVQDGKDETVQKQREKRKWQIALRRYIMLESPCSFYAPYFGLDAPLLRKWIELHFTNGQTWDSFSNNWQLEHIVPVSFFDFELEADLKLCWNFLNIRVEPLQNGKKTSTVPDLLSAKLYYERLYKQTNHAFCSQMLMKINSLPHDLPENTARLETFIQEHSVYIAQLGQLGPYQFDQLNAGVDLNQVLAEMKLIGK